MRSRARACVCAVIRFFCLLARMCLCVRASLLISQRPVVVGSVLARGEMFFVYIFFAINNPLIASVFK